MLSFSSLNFNRKHKFAFTVCDSKTSGRFFLLIDMTSNNPSGFPVVANWKPPTQIPTPTATAPKPPIQSALKAKNSVKPPVKRHVTFAPTTAIDIENHTERYGDRNISWNNLTVSVFMKAEVPGLFGKVTDGKAEENERIVLRNIYGTAKSGEMIAIMGSQGAGKSTLLHVLASIDQRHIRKAGSRVLIDGKPLRDDQMRLISGYVPQDDQFIGLLTVKEQFDYSSRLRMDPKRFSKIVRVKRVDRLMKEMKLTRCRDKQIGEVGHGKGLSRDQRKRLAIGCELLNNIDFFFCDEPTSDMESYAANQVADILHELAAKQRKTVITTIYEPSDDLLQRFDKVCLLACENKQSRVAYFGPPSELLGFLNEISRPFKEYKKSQQLKRKLKDNSEDIELACPKHSGLIEHAMRIISRTPSDTKDSFSDRVRFIREKFERTAIGIKQKQLAVKALFLTNEHVPLSKVVTESVKIEKKSVYPVNWFVQFQVLFYRSLKINNRRLLSLLNRLFQVVLTAFFVGLINWQTPITGPTMTNFEGIFFNCARDMSYLFIFPSVYAIAREFPIMAREHLNDHYSVSAYFFGRTIVEFPQYTILPIIYSTLVYWMAGLEQELSKFCIFCLFNIFQTWIAISVAYFLAYIFESEYLALAYFPLILQPLTLLGGFYIRFHNIPLYFKWLSSFSWFRYSFEGLQINQWAELEVVPGCNTSLPSDYCPAATGLGYLKRRDMNAENLIVDALTLFLIVLITRLYALIALTLKMRWIRG
ncbi:ABC transporter ATP-binding protein/permease wht-1 [Aphelenchoides besseyi]|nr:ABC transporter ATP-binding protein/permease wht-1 [Aphelenchoides besseyi]